MAVILNPVEWQGKLDQEELPCALRWHQKVTLCTQEIDETKIYRGMIGFCSDEGVKRNNGRIGAAQGPAAFRRQLSNIAWHEDDCSLIDFGDVIVECNDLEAGQELLAERVAAEIPKVSRLLVVGGGHETAYGSFCGLYKALGKDCKIGIINLDAHFDLRCPGDSGASSGTPFYQIQTLVGADDFHYFCLGLAEEANTQALFHRADSWGVTYRKDKQVKENDLEEIKIELENFAQTCDALYLTIDMDVLPHYQAPGVSAPAVRGVELRVIESIIGLVISSSRYCTYGLPLVEITELNPSFDPQGVTARTAGVLAGQMLK
ncbi:formimidoylglutamase [Gammaproteobacteria bacterium AS21]